MYMKKIITFYILLVSALTLSSVKAQIINPVKWILSSKEISNCTYELIFTGIIQDRWHVYSTTMTAGDGPSPAKITVNKNTGYEIVGKTSEGKPIITFDKVFEMNVAYFEKTVTFKQIIKLKTDKEVTVKGEYEYQACTEERCVFPPATPFEFRLKCTKKKGVKLIPVEIK
jgi:hypothetical protein